MKTSLPVVVTAFLSLLSGCSDGNRVSEADFEAQRAALLAKPRQYIADNDGCDMLYYNTARPITEKAFIDSRIGFVAGTRIDTLVYTPTSAGFGQFTALKAGELITKTLPWPNSTNAVSAFAAIGKDCLQMAIDFCRREHKEIFLGIRVNDGHDSYTPGLLPRWKLDNPDCLYGKEGDKLPRGTWSSVDFENSKVRAYMLKFMRQFFENYDVDGVCYDFNRHFNLFKSVAWGRDAASAHATQAQIALMNGFMRELRALTDEFGRKRGKPILVAVRVYDSFEYDLAAGADVAGWLKDKSVDFVIGAGYFQLNPWHVTAKRVQALGGRFYASMDESRIGQLPTPFHPLGYLKGRQDWKTFYPARIAAAMSEGCDGIFFFNFQGQPLKEIGSIDPCATEGHDKTYFAVDRGSGGGLPWNYVFRGETYSTMNKLDPWKPQEVAPGGRYPFEIVIGDNLDSPKAKAAPPKATAFAMMDYLKREDVKLAVNGTRLDTAGFFCDNTTNGTFRFDVPLCALRRGNNRFELCAPTAVPAGGKIHFIDFKLTLDYPKSK